MAKVYYNEFDKKKCAMLKQLMADGHIAKGDIDDRSIAEVEAYDLWGYDRCHFFAGIGLWEYALQLAGWEEDRAVWTGSCPCQSFSTAGRQKGKADDRHLWPEWERLIRECRPATVFGEQVPNAIAHGWLDDVYQGLEAEDYAVGAVTIPASAVAAPHRRERLWFVANLQSEQSDGLQQQGVRADTRPNCTSTLGNAEHDGQPTASKPRSNDASVQHNSQGQDSTSESARASYSCDVANTDSARPQGYRRFEQEPISEGWEGAERYPWASGVWVDCPDGKQRLIEPTIPLLANGDSFVLASVHGIIIEEAIERIVDYGSETNTSTAETLRRVRQDYGEKAIYEREIAGLKCLPEAEVLLSFLQRVESTLEASRYGSSIEEKDETGKARLMRGVQLEKVFRDSPCRWKPYEQFAREFTDPLRVLPLFLAQCAKASWAITNQENAKAVLNVKGARVAILHAIGDGIVPQVAAEFIKAAM